VIWKKPKHMNPVRLIDTYEFGNLTINLQHLGLSHSLHLEGLNLLQQLYMLLLLSRPNKWSIACPFRIMKSVDQKTRELLANVRSEGKQGNAVLKNIANEADKLDPHGHASFQQDCDAATLKLPFMTLETLLYTDLLSHK